MARRSSSSSSSSSGAWRYLNPAYYLKRPKRLALLFFVFVAATFAFWDRQSLVREYELEISRLDNQIDQLHDQLRKAGVHLDENPISDQMPRKDHVEINPINNERREKVKEAMRHAWNSYVKYAWGMDELQPQSKKGTNSFGGLGATLVDSLDTLYIMGLRDEFQKARDWVAESLSFDKDYDASVFETTIRVVGGLLSAYDLSGDKVFLEKAKDITDRLLPAWDTASGIPYNRINLAHGRAHNPGWTNGDSILADSGTEQLEFIALSQRTGDPKYQQKAENVIRQLQKIYPSDGLLPMYINPHSGTASYSTITFGAMGDSFYEYLLKVWIQGNKTEHVKHYRQMWETSMEGLISLTRKTTPSNYYYICEKNGGSLSDKMDELACFAPGMLALGASGYGSEKAGEIMNLAKELARTCYNFYQSTPTKLAGENYFFHGGQDDKNIAHLTHVSEMEKKCESLARITTILKDVIQNKDRIIARLQQPYSLDCIPVEAEYQKQFSELLLKAASDYGALTASVGDFQWSQNFRESPAVWGEMLRPIPAALASCTRFFEAMSAMRESFSTLQKLRVGHSSLSMTPGGSTDDSKFLTPPQWRDGSLDSWKQVEDINPESDGLDGINQRRLSWPSSIKRDV